MIPAKQLAQLREHSIEDELNELEKEILTRNAMGIVYLPKHYHSVELAERIADELQQYGYKIQLDIKRDVKQALLTIMWD